MLPFFAAVIIMGAQGSVDPLNLPIGPKGDVKVEPGQIVDTQTQKSVTVEDIAKAADGKRFVFLGENHATTLDQQLEADLIEALVKRGRQVVVGVEMYTRPKQDFLMAWSQGLLTEDEFLTKSDWKHEWGYDYTFYRPVFESVKNHKLPLIALNIPRDWVRTVVREGYKGLTSDQRKQLPKDIDLTNTTHHTIFDALMGPHPKSGPMPLDMYAGQVLWDEGMADTAIKYMDRNKPTPQTVFVVIAGAGHVMYGQGINYRIEKRTHQTGVSVVMSQSKDPVTVAKGLGDFVYITAPPEAKGAGVPPPSLNVGAALP